MDSFEDHDFRTNMHDEAEEQLVERNETLRRENKRYQELAETDQLTGLANRRKLMEEIERDTEIRPQYEGEERRSLNKDIMNRVSTLLFTDVDRFKHINDTYGHDVGDMVLQRVADFLKSFVRPGDVLARYGGEEFAAYLKGAEPGTILNRLREREGHAGEMRPEGEGGLSFEMEIPSLNDQMPPIPLKVTMSGGMVKVLPGAKFEKVIKLADDLAYKAKREGRDKIFTESSNVEEAP